MQANSLPRHDGLQIAEGKFYLGDAGYACRPGILPPFRKTRYHLNEFTPRNQPQNAKVLFNPRHSNLRVTIEGLYCIEEQDDFFQEEFTFYEVGTDQGVEAGDNEAWKEKDKSGQTECGKPEATPPFEKEKNKSRSEVKKKKKKNPL
ncbi:hypothetical protein QYE76_043601 [Lolium multiflorum]|uniref:DDE Tnp4 domain-containing protein n=1 Tax=Lolium multiflorum TaxID=4521 RepID=A0AAD8TJ05_LOLMU|nr:hypothetical protein QYE76_043601 [Lolium multiflorum]